MCYTKDSPGGYAGPWRHDCFTNSSSQLRCPLCQWKLSKVKSSNSLIYTTVFVEKKKCVHEFPFNYLHHIVLYRVKKYLLLTSYGKTCVPIQASLFVYAVPITGYLFLARHEDNMPSACMLSLEQTFKSLNQCSSQGCNKD